MANDINDIIQNLNDIEANINSIVSPDNVVVMQKLLDVARAYKPVLQKLDRAGFNVKSAMTSIEDIESKANNFIREFS